MRERVGDRVLSISYQLFAPLQSERVSVYVSPSGQALTWNTHTRTIRPTRQIVVREKTHKSQNPTKYVMLHIVSRGKERCFRLHRAVALLYVPGYDLFHNEIDHRNSLKCDNRAENLEWVSHDENMRRAYANFTPEQRQNRREICRKASMANAKKALLKKQQICHSNSDQKPRHKGT